jgi:Glyoxalase-like domain
VNGRDDGPAQAARFEGQAMPRTLIAATLACQLFATVASTAVQAPRSISLDHVVLAVHDLDAAAVRYRRLGFALKPGRPHQNGIRNEAIGRRPIAPSISRTGIRRTV